MFVCLFVCPKLSATEDPQNIICNIVVTVSVVFEQFTVIVSVYLLVEEKVWEQLSHCTLRPTAVQW